MTKEPDKLIDSIVHYSMEKGGADRLQSYLDRGRAYGKHTQAALEDAYVDAMAVWARNVHDINTNVLASDLAAEFTLRGIETPSDRTRASLDVITSEIVKHIMDLSDDQREEMTVELIHEYFDGLHRRN